MRKEFNVMTASELAISKKLSVDILQKKQTVSNLVRMLGLDNYTDINLLWHAIVREYLNLYYGDSVVLPPRETSPAYQTDSPRELTKELTELRPCVAELDVDRASRGGYF
jgi:hypothetical protein